MQTWMQSGLVMLLKGFDGVIEAGLEDTLERWFTIVAKQLKTFSI